VVGKKKEMLVNSRKKRVPPRLRGRKGHGINLVGKKKERAASYLNQDTNRAGGEEFRSARGLTESGRGGPHASKKPVVKKSAIQ